MTERRPETFTPTENDRLQIVPFQEGLLHEIEKPTDGDPRIRAFAQATLEEIQRGGPLVDSLIEVFAWHRYIDDKFPSPYARRLLLRALQKQALSLQEQNILELPYPEAFRDPAAWRYLLNYRTDYAELGDDMSSLRIQSNISERYKSIPLTWHALTDRLGPNPRVLDVGCSMNIGLRKLQLLDDYPFGYTTGIKQLSESPIWTEDLAVSRGLESLLNLPNGLGRSIGIDLHPVLPDDEEMRQWIKSNSFYPSELLTDIQRVEEFNELSRIKEVENAEVYYKITDASDKEMIGRFKDDQRAWRPDLIVASTVMHQMTKSQVAETIANMRFLSDNKAVMLINDFVQVNPDAQNGLTFINQERWVEPFTYRTLVRDFATDEPWQEYYHWANGRCHQILLTDIGRTALGL